MRTNKVILKEIEGKILINLNFKLRKLTETNNKNVKPYYLILN